MAEQTEALLIGLVSFLLCAIVITLISHCTIRQNTFEEAWKDREENLKILGFKRDKKEKKKKLKKISKVSRQDKSDGDVRGSVGDDSDVDEETSSESPHLDEFSSEIQDGASLPDAFTVCKSSRRANQQPRQKTGRLALRGGTSLHESGNKGSVLNIPNPGCERRTVRQDSSGCRRRNLLMEEDRSCASSTAGDCRASVSNDLWNNNISESRTDDTKEVESTVKVQGKKTLHAKMCCGKLELENSRLQKLNQTLETEVEAFRVTLNATRVQNLHETREMHVRYEGEVKKLTEESRKLNEANRTMQEETFSKNKLVNDLKVTIGELRENIKVMGSALEASARIYNSSENGRKNAEAKNRHYEARLIELEEATVKEESRFSLKMNEVSAALEAKTKNFERVLTELEKLRIENSMQHSIQRQHEELKKTIELLKTEKENLQIDCDSKLLQISMLMGRNKTDAERHFAELEEEVKRREAEIQSLKEAVIRRSSMECLEQFQKEHEGRETASESKDFSSSLKPDNIVSGSCIDSLSTIAGEEATESTREVATFAHINDGTEKNRSQLIVDLKDKDEKIRELQSLLSQQESKLRCAEAETAQVTMVLEQLQQETESNHVLRKEWNFQRTNGEVNSDDNSIECQLLRDQLRSTENELKRLEKELKVLRGSTENLTDINFAYHCVEKSLTSIVDEMEVKIQDLQNRLDSVEAEKLETFLELSQLRATHERVLVELHELRQTITVDPCKEESRSQ